MLISEEMTVIPCLGCRKDLRVPKTHVRASIRDRRPFVRFCSRECNLKYVAINGAKQQEEQLRDAD